MDNHRFSKKALAKWVERFQLENWVIKLRRYTRLPLDLQFCDFGYSEKVARVGINITQSQVDLEHDMAHELAHLVESPQNRVFDNLVESFVPKDDRRAWADQYNLAQNESIEHWLRIIYTLSGESYPPHEAIGGEN